MSYGSGVRAQVFEVIVRQAISGAPWREICAGPMQVNSIDPEDIQKEVDNRINRYMQALSPAEHDALQHYISKWEDTTMSRAKETFAPFEKIESLVEKIYEQQGLSAPKVILCHSPAAYMLYLIAFNKNDSATSNWSEQLFPDQDSSYFEILESEIAKLIKKTKLGNPKSEEFSSALVRKLHSQDGATLRPSRQINGESAFTDSQVRSFYRSFFGLKVQPFLNRLATLFETSLAQIPEANLRLIQSPPNVPPMALPLTVQSLRQQIWGLWQNMDILAYGFINEKLSDKWHMSDECSRLLDDYLALFSFAPWISFFEHCCFVGVYPKEVVLDLRSRPHNANGPAIIFQDDYKVFALNGMATPRRFLEAPESLTIADIDREENVEQRRGLIELYGPARYITDSNATLINQDDYGELYQIEIDGDEPLTMVRVKNATMEPDGSYRTYFLRVPPYIATAREAVAWTFSFDSAEDYEPIEES